MKKTVILIAALVVAAGLGVHVMGQGLMILKGLATSDHLSVTELGTSAEVPTQTNQLVLSIECDDKGTYVRGTFMLLKDQYVVCKGHTVSFGDSFKRSGKSFKIGATTVTSNGKAAMVEGQEADGIFWDGSTATILKPKGATQRGTSKPRSDSANATGPDENLIALGKKKAEELGYNPLYAFMSDQATIALAKGTQFSMRNGQFAIVKGDMFINVGEKPIKADNLTLMKGEYALAEEGGLKKGEQNLLSQEKKVNP